MSPKRPARLIERKLGREEADGLVKPLPSDARRYSNTIHIDSRLPPKAWLDAVVHELLHINFPTLSEEAVLASGTHIAKSLWSYGVRRVQQ